MHGGGVPRMAGPGADSGRRPPANSEELMLRTAGKTLYRLFFAPYTLKQWGVPATDWPLLSADAFQSAPTGMIPT